MAKDRFVTVSHIGNGIGFSGLRRVERIIVDTKTGVNYAPCPLGGKPCASWWTGTASPSSPP